MLQSQQPPGCSASNQRRKFSVFTAQQLHTQGDPLVPLPGNHAHVPGVERGLKQILLMAGVVKVALEKLQNKVSLEANDCV